jgi:hypothetical protein
LELSDLGPHGLREILAGNIMPHPAPRLLAALKPGQNPSFVDRPFFIRSPAERISSQPGNKAERSGFHNGLTLAFPTLFFY